MKKFFFLAPTLLAASALAAVAVSFNVSDANAARLDRERLRVNKVACNSYGLPDACTQAQARAAFCAREGASAPTHPCTFNGVDSSTVRIYGTTSEFVDVEVIKEYTRELKARQDQEDRSAAKASWDAKTQAERDAICASFGLSAGCTLW